MDGLEGKAAVVTGAASGIGLAVARLLASEGARVVVSDVDPRRLEEAVAAVSREGGHVVGALADVSQEDQVRAMVKRATDAFGRLDIAVNNAGIEGTLAPTGEHPVEAWRRVIDVNLTGVFLCMRHEIPAMAAAGGGSIVNMASILGLVGLQNAPAYVAAKHGVVGLTKAAALEYAAKGIRVNAVCPGFIETPMVMERGLHAGTDRDAYQQLVKLHPMGRLGRPEEIAKAVAWLASGESAFVTGQTLTADGGYVAR